MDQPTIYDKKQVYQEEIAPLVKQLAALCKQSGIPYFFSAAVVNTESGTEYFSECNSAIPMNIFLQDDKIVEHLKICSGCRAIIPGTIPSLEV